MTSVNTQQRETTTCQQNHKNVNDSFVPSDDEEENWSGPPLIQDGSPHEINKSTRSVLSETSLNDSLNNSDNYDIFGEVKALRDINRKRPIIGYLNINSVRYKFSELRQIFDDKLVDIFAIAETKIDNSFNDNMFSIEGYKMDRRDRNRYGGGIMTFVRADLPIKRRPDLECQTIETVCFELELCKRKWGILCTYRSPSTPDKTFNDEISTVLNKMYINFDHVIIFSDLNYDMLNSDKCKPINNLISSFNLTNLIQKPTCFTKNGTPSLIDIILTNSCNLLCNTKIVNCSISDCHCMILTTLKEQVHLIERKKVNFRSYKNFNEDIFEKDLSCVPFHVAHIFDDIDDICWANLIFI